MEQRINEEAERARHYLDASTEKIIVKVVEEELITAHMKTIVDMEHSGVVRMLENHKIDGEFVFLLISILTSIYLVKDLARMYKLFSRVDNGLKTIIACVSNHLRQEGKSLVTDDGNKEDAISFVTVTLEFSTIWDTNHLF